MASLTQDDLRIIRNSLDYSIQRVSDYPHANCDEKKMSLRPIEQARQKVRELIAEIKESKEGR